MTLDSLLDHLIAKGFVRYENYLRAAFDSCHWYAARQVGGNAVNCMGNDRPPQIIVYGHRIQTLPPCHAESVEIVITGLRAVGSEWRGPWFKLQAYAITPAEAARDLPAIEAALVRAWNAISPEQPHA